MESEEETEGECERRQWYGVVFYSSKQVHGGLGVATRERAKEHAIGGRSGAASPYERVLGFLGRGVRGKGLAKLGMVVLTCAQKVLERVLTAAWGRRDDVGVSAGSWRGWGVARLSGACSGAEAAEVGVRVHAHVVRGLGARDSAAEGNPRARQLTNGGRGTGRQGGAASSCHTPSPPCFCRLT